MANLAADAAVVALNAHDFKFRYGQWMDINLMRGSFPKNFFNSIVGCAVTTGEKERHLNYNFLQADAIDRDREREKKINTTTNAHKGNGNAYLCSGSSQTLWK